MSAKAENMIHIPDWMSLRNAGAIPEVWLTAFQLIYHISIVTKNSDEEIRKKKFLVHAGASGKSFKIKF